MKAAVRHEQRRFHSLACGASGLNDVAMAVEARNDDICSIRQSTVAMIVSALKSFALPIVGAQLPEHTPEPVPWDAAEIIIV